MKIHPMAVYRIDEVASERFRYSLTNDEEQYITSNKAFPLVRELMHKYDLQVLGVRGETIEGANIYLSRSDGFPVCKVHWAKQKESFAFRNIMVCKERGRNFEDKLIYYAKRVPHLMKTIKEQRLMPESTDDAIRQLFISHVRESVLELSHTFGDVYKSARLDGEHVHKLIRIVLDNQSTSILSKESMALIQETLDKYNAIDSIRAKRMEELNEVFKAPMYMAMHDSLHSFLVGKVNIKPTFGGNDAHSINTFEMNIVEPFVRYRDVTDVPDIIPTMAMLKSSLEQRYPSIRYVGESGFFPEKYKGVIPELRLMSFHAKNDWGNMSLLKPSILLMPS
jgi:hypothetical protein